MIIASLLIIVHVNSQAIYPHAHALCKPTLTQNQDMFVTSGGCAFTVVTAGLHGACKIERANVQLELVLQPVLDCPIWAPRLCPPCGNSTKEMPWAGPWACCCNFEVDCGPTADRLGTFVHVELLSDGCKVGASYYSAKSPGKRHS